MIEACPVLASYDGIAGIPHSKFGVCKTRNENGGREGGGKEGREREISEEETRPSRQVEREDSIGRLGRYGRYERYLTSVKSRVGRIERRRDGRLSKIEVEVVSCRVLLCEACSAPKESTQIDMREEISCPESEIKIISNKGGGEDATKNEKQRTRLLHSDRSR